MQGCFSSDCLLGECLIFYAQHNFHIFAPAQHRTITQISDHISAGSMKRWLKVNSDWQYMSLSCLRCIYFCEYFNYFLFDKKVGLPVLMILYEHKSKTGLQNFYHRNFPGTESAILENKSVLLNTLNQQSTVCAEAILYNWTNFIHWQSIFHAENSNFAWEKNETVKC